MAQSESELQAIIVAYFRYNYPQYLIYSSLNGVKISGSNKYGIIAKQKKEGMLNGVADLEVILPNKVLFIELKTAIGKQSPDQIVMQQKLTELGHSYYLVRSLEEFKQVISKHL